MGRDGGRRLRCAQDAAIIWALSNESTRNVIGILTAEARRCTTGDVERLQQLADGVEFLLRHNIEARKKLLKWMRHHMDGNGPDQALSHRATLSKFQYTRG